MKQISAPPVQPICAATIIFIFTFETNMADNKHAQTRYRALDKCFANPYRKYFVEDLLEACKEALEEITPGTKGIARRQLFDDINYMKSEAGFKAPITSLKEGKKTYYRYSEDFSIENQPLNQAEIEQVKAAINVLGRIKGMPQFEWINELTPKLEQSFLLSKGETEIISFDNNDYLRGIEYLGPLFHHILYKRPLCITYQSYKSDKPSKFVLHPYYLKQYNNRWFLLGDNTAIEKLSVLALDRILEIQEEKIPWRPNEKYDFNEYFEDIIGVTLPEGGVLERVVLEFNKEAAPYVLSKPIHGSQKSTCLENGRAIITIEVIPNYELESLILSFGERVKILQPEGLQRQITGRIRAMHEQY